MTHRGLRLLGRVGTALGVASGATAAAGAVLWAIDGRETAIGRANFALVRQRFDLLGWYEGGLILGLSLALSLPLIHIAARGGGAMRVTMASWAGSSLASVLYARSLPDSKCLPGSVGPGGDVFGYPFCTNAPDIAWPVLALGMQAGLVSALCAGRCVMAVRDSRFALALAWATLAGPFAVGASLLIPKGIKWTFSFG